MADNIFDKLDEQSEILARIDKNTANESSTVEEMMVLKAENDSDPYLHCKSKREQNQIEGFSARIEPDEFNIAKRQKKSTRNAEYKLRKSRCAEYDAKRKIFEYYGIA